MVGLMLIGLGIDVLRRQLRERIHFHVHRHADGHLHFHAHSHAGEKVHAAVHHYHHLTTRAGFRYGRCLLA